MTYDLFIAYASADLPWVEGYLLPALDLPPNRVLTPRRFEPGLPSVTALERAVSYSRYTVLILTPAFLADEWTQYSDQLSSFTRVVDRQSRLIPLHLKPCTLPLHLDFLVRLDCTAEINWPGEVNRLRELLSQPAPVSEQIPCPYPGLVPFSGADSRWFFGREQEIINLRRKLRHQNLLLVIGPSGSGKSSLVFAGLAPYLQTQEPHQWQIRSMRPGALPCDALNTSIGDLINLQDSPPSLKHGSQPQLLLIVDQFEEIFVQAPKSEQNAFIAGLKTLCLVRGCQQVLTMRADFFPDLMNSALWPIDPSQREEIAPLHADALRRAIEQPAASVGVYFDSGLVERLLSDAADEPGVLPLLQETLVLLWEQRTHRFLPLSAYERMGGLAVAIASEADAALALLTPAQQALARRIFLRLIQFGEGRPDTRRQQQIAALRSAGDNDAILKTVLDHLVDHRLLTLTVDELRQTQCIDLSHEKLITCWPQLRAWVSERKTYEQVRRRLEEHALEWARLGRGEDGLLDRALLHEALDYISSPNYLEIGASNDLVKLVEVSMRAINPGWNSRGVFGLATVALTLLALVGLVFLLMPENLSPTPWLLMVSSSLLVLVSAGVITFWLLRRADRFVLQRWTHAITRCWLARAGIVGAAAAAVSLWAVVGTKQVVIAQQCALAGFDRQNEQLAVLNTNVTSPYVALFATQFQRISRNRLQAQVALPATARLCRGYLNYWVTLSEEGQGTQDALYVAKVEGSGKLEIVQRPASQGCGAMLMMPYDILNRLGFMYGTMADDLPAPATVKCAALAAFEEARQHQKRREWALAAGKYREAIAEDDSYIEAHVNLGAVLCRLGRDQEAVKELQYAVTRSVEPSVDILRKLGYACYTAGDLACAKAALENARARYEAKGTANDQKSIILYLDLGVVYQEYSLYTRAQVLFERFEAMLAQDRVNLRSNQIVLEKARGILNFRMGDLASAEKYLLSADRRQQFSVVDRIAQIIAAQVSEEITTEMIADYQYWDEEITYYLSQVAVQRGDLDAACAYLVRYQHIPASYLYQEADRRMAASQQIRAFGCSQSFHVH